MPKFVEEATLRSLEVSAPIVSIEEAYATILFGLSPVAAGLSTPHKLRHAIVGIGATVAKVCRDLKLYFGGKSFEQSLAESLKAVRRKRQASVKTPVDAYGHIAFAIEALKQNVYAENYGATRDSFLTIAATAQRIYEDLGLETAEEPVKRRLPDEGK